MNRITGFAAWLALAGVSLLPAASESALREAFLRQTGEIHLPPGTTVLTRPLEVSADARDLVISGTASTLLRASPKFVGRALIHVQGGTRISLRDFTLDGNRAALATRIGMPPSNQPFHRYYANNGIVAEGVTELQSLFANVPPPLPPA